MDKVFAATLLPGLAAARIAFLAGKLEDAAAKTELVWARFLARALGRNPEDIVDLDADALVRTLGTFPEWPFDPEESRVLWEAFKPGAWQALDAAALDQKINELTAFHESSIAQVFQLLAYLLLWVTDYLLFLLHQFFDLKYRVPCMRKQSKKKNSCERPFRINMRFITIGQGDSFLN